VGSDPRISLPAGTGKPLSRYFVKSPQAWLRRKPGSNAAVETQLLFGQEFLGYKLHNQYVWGQAVSPIKSSRLKGYIGFMRLSDLEEREGPPGHIIHISRAPVFSKPDLKSRITSILPMGALLRFERGDAGQFRQLNTGGFVHKRHFLRGHVSHKNADYVSIAERYADLPYIWGGTGCDGVDCSGLVQSSLRATGVDAPRDADQQEAYLGAGLPVKIGGLKRGDLVFWKGHVGIMQSAKKMIHANAFHMGVASERLIDARERIADSGHGGITSIRRMTER